MDFFLNAKVLSFFRQTGFHISLSGQTKILGFSFVAKTSKKVKTYVSSWGKAFGMVHIVTNISTHMWINSIDIRWHTHSQTQQGNWLVPIKNGIFTFSRMKTSSNVLFLNLMLLHRNSNRIRFRMLWIGLFWYRDICSHFDWGFQINLRRLGDA